MGGLASRISALAMALGAPGLFLVAFLDSSFLSLPEIADLMVVYMVTRNKARVAAYVASAVAGSVMGCLVMYSIGRKGGEALVRNRFAQHKVERAMHTVQRYGMMSVLIPSLLPPPAPFKIFVLLAGVAGVGVWRFLAALVIGRGARYVTLGVLAIAYGDSAMAYMRNHGVTVSLAAVGVLAATFALYLLWSKTQAGTS
jgi:membrane protein YqaA with SNARE-associated domain